MTEDTRISQLAETVEQLQVTVEQLQVASTALAEEQTKQGVLLEKILQQLNNLASNYDHLVQVTTRRNSGEGTSQNTRIQASPLFEGHGGIQARTLRLDLPRFDGDDPSEWILKSAVSKAVEVGNKNNLTRAVKTYADSVVHQAGQAVAEGAKILQDCIGNRSYKSAKPTAKRLKEVAISCRGKERVLLLRRWVVVLKQFEKLSGGSTEILQAIPNHPNKLGKLHINSIYPKTPTSTRYFTFHAPRKKIGDQINPNPRLPRVMEEGTLVPEPEKILERRLKQKKAKKKNSSSNNNTGNVVEKKEGGENKKGGDEVEKKQENSPVPVVLKVEMHCDGCVSTILKFVRSFEGVESEATSNKLTVTGKVDPLEIRDYLNHKTKKKGNHAGVECLVQGEMANEEDAMCIGEEELRKKWLELEDEFY